MAANEKIEKSYANLGKQGDLFTVRTMKGDVERLRQGLPLIETPYAGQTPPQFTPSRRLASDISEHNPSELPPQEVRQAPSVSTRATQPSADMPLAADAVQRPTMPTYAAEPYAGGTTLPVRDQKPIEALQPKAQPSLPAQPRGGIIETAKSVEEPIGDRSASEKFVTVLRRIFPSQKRIMLGMSAGLCVLVLGAYAIFAAFGKPLPGWRFVFADPQTSPQATATEMPIISPLQSAEPSVSTTSAPTPSPSAMPLITPALTPKATFLPMRRIGIVEFVKDSTQLDAIEKLINIAFIAGQMPGDFTQLMVRHKENSADFTLAEFSDLLDISIPDDVLAELASVPTIFFYAPRDAKTGPGENGGILAPAHIGLLVAVSGSVEKAHEALRRWEATLGGDIVPLALGREWRPGGDVLFQSNMFQGAHIRYQNFPDPYLAADYTVFEGIEAPLLVFATSRESMFTVIGTLNYRSE